MAGSGMHVPEVGPGTLGTASPWVPGELRGSPGHLEGRVAASRAARTSRGGLGSDAVCCFSLVCVGHPWPPPALLIAVFPPAGLAAPVKALGCGNSPQTRRCLDPSACSGGSHGFSAALPVLYPWERAGGLKACESRRALPAELTPLCQVCWHFLWHRRCPPAPVSPSDPSGTCSFPAPTAERVKKRQKQPM